ncbi:MAG: phosphoribosylaminoimidazolesuccinocarboxamide synthase [Clostridia bacterium]
MELIYKGKTKDVYQLADGTIKLMFKDDVTCANGVFDPGANHTGIKIDGSGLAGLKMSKKFFEILNAKGIPTHYIGCDLNEKSMHVLKVTTFGKGLEVICRTRSTGSFMKRYGAYAVEGQNLDYFVETTFKDDEREDPLVSGDCLAELGVMTLAQYDDIKKLTKEMTKIIENELKKFDLTLYDIKFEFGVNEKGVLLIDELSGGNMRVYKGDKILMPIELSDIVTKNM